MGQVNPEIVWRTVGSRACLKFTFTGYLTDEDAQRAIVEWRRAFNSLPNEPICIVWDCLQMEGFSHKARSEWTRALQDMKGQINSIWVITKSSIVKMGATVMGMFSGMNIHIVKSEEEIHKTFTPPPSPFLHDPPRNEPSEKIHSFWD